MAQNPFEMPREVRSAAEEGVKKAREAFDTYMNATTQAVTKVEQASESTQSTANDMQKEAMAFAEEQVNAAFDLAQKMINASSPQEVMAIQSTYMQDQMQRATSQSKAVGEQIQKVAQDVAESLKPS